MRVASLLLAAVAAGLLAAPALAQDPAGPRRVSGEIVEDASWSGEILLAGDVTVAKGTTLRIRPGTHIAVAPLSGLREPSSPRDLRADRAEILVLGRIEALGTEDDPIRLGAPPKWIIKKEGKRPRVDCSWLGIVLAPEREGRSRFSRCVFRGALGGVQCGSGSPEIEDCVFLDCSIGVGAGTIWGDRKGERRIRSRLPGPVLRRCRFGGCDTGIYVDRGGRPTVERSIFLDCTVGIGRWAGGMTYPMQGLGPLVERCDFLGNHIAVYGSGSIRDSIFTKNRLAMAASSFHRLYGSNIDRYHRAHNVYFDNHALANEDIPAGEGARFMDPGYRGPVEVSRALLLLPDLEAVLGLRPDSPVLGAAGDGGDPGAFGKVGTARSADAGRPPPEGLPLDRWLLAGPPGNFTDEDVASVKKAIRQGRARGLPAPGVRLGKGVWALLPADGGVLRPPPVGAAEDVLLLAGVTASREGTASLFLGYDGLLVEAFWGGGALRAPENPRRFDPQDLTFEVPLKKGRNLLLVRARLRAPGARIAAHLSTRDGVLVTPLFATPPEPPGPIVDRITVAAGRGRRPGRVNVYLAFPAHWIDVLDPGAWRVTGPDGARIPVARGAIVYDAARPKVILDGLTLRRGETYRLETMDLRDCWGRPAEVDGSDLRAAAK